MIVLPLVAPGLYIESGAAAQRAYFQPDTEHVVLQTHCFRLFGEDIPYIHTF